MAISGYLFNWYMQARFVDVAPHINPLIISKLHIGQNSGLLNCNTSNISFLDETCQNIGVDEKQQPLAIFDHFKVQMTEQVIQELEDNYIHSALISANYTGLLQPMDVSILKVV